MQILDKIDFKFEKKVTRPKGKHNILKVLVWEVTTIKNIHSSEIQEAKLDRNKGKNSSTIIVEDFNTPHSITNRSTRQKINREIEGLKNTKHTYTYHSTP